MFSFQVVVALGWILSFAVALTIVYAIYPVVRNIEAWDNAVESAFYAGLARPGFAACVAWVIIACISGYGGIAFVGLHFHQKCYFSCRVGNSF